jgi:hypothetical protein
MHKIDASSSSFVLSIYSATHVAYTIIHLLSLYTHMLLLTKDDYVLSLLATVYTSTFTRRESLSTLHDVVVNVFFLSLSHSAALFRCIVVVLLLSVSILTCFVRTREGAVQGVDKLLTPSMHLCARVYVLPFFTSTHFSFLTYYQFSLSLVFVFF